MKIDSDPSSKPLPGTAGRLLEILSVSAKLGLTSFGGPIAHLGYFREEYVRRRSWLDERSYAELVALCQFLPGPASSQVGIGIGIVRGGVLGGLAAWIGFTLPSILLLIAFAVFVQHFDIAGSGWIHGLKIAAVAVVAQALLGMGKSLAPDRARATFAVLAAAAVLLWPSAFIQIAVIAAAAAGGLLLLRAQEPDIPELSVPVGRKFALFCLILFAVLLLGLPILRTAGSGIGLGLADSFYRAGALVFGGGHVVLPLLEREVVPTGWIGASDFLAGYGAAQAVPGPLFTFGAYLGWMIGGLKGALIGTVAIFLPAFLLISGTLPFWSTLRQNTRVQQALLGVNAAVVGILLAALYDPLWTSTIRSAVDFAGAAGLFVLLVFWKTPPWIVVALGAAGGWILGMFYG